MVSQQKPADSLNCLVVYLPLWKIWKSVEAIIPNIWNNNPNVQNHQPVNHDETVKNLQESMVSSPQNHWRKGPIWFPTSSYMISQKFIYVILLSQKFPWVFPYIWRYIWWFSMVFLWIFHDFPWFPMIFPWFSHDFPCFSMVFQWFFFHSAPRLNEETREETQHLRSPQRSGGRPGFGRRCRTWRFRIGKDNGDVDAYNIYIYIYVMSKPPTRYRGNISTISTISTIYVMSTPD